MGSSSPSALGSLRRLWLCKGLKSAKFLADKVQNLHNIRSPWGLAVLDVLPTGPNCLLFLQSPPLTGGLVVSLPAGSEQGRGKKTLLSVSLGTGGLGMNSVGFFHCLAVGLCFFPCEMGDEETVPHS